jgi:hypothetical protein
MPIFGYEKCVGGNQQSRKIQIYEIFLYSIIFFIFALKAVGLSYTNKSKFCIFEHATFYCTRFFFKLVDFFRLRIFYSKRQEKKSRPKMYTPFFTVRKNKPVVLSEKNIPRIELLFENIDWLLTELEKIPSKTYLLFDFPGQAELYSVHDCVEKLLAVLNKQDIRLAALYFTEARHAADAHSFTGSVLATLSAMLRLSLPAVNVLSKIDVAPRLPVRVQS